jgi:transcriptional regulator with XRE-family HTH domain
MDKYSDIEYEVGAAVRQARIRRGLTLEDVAARASLSPTSVRSLELGRGSGLTTLIKVLDVIGEMRLFENWIAAGKTFSPVEMFRRGASEERKPMRVSRKRKTGNG